MAEAAARSGELFSSLGLVAGSQLFVPSCCIPESTSDKLETREKIFLKKQELNLCCLSYDQSFTTNILTMRPVTPMIAEFMILEINFSECYTEISEKNFIIFFILFILMLIQVLKYK